MMNKLTEFKYLSKEALDLVRKINQKHEELNDINIIDGN